MTDINPELTELMKFDSLSAAEKLTGKSYKENDGVTALGMLMAMSHNKVKEEKLAAAGDTSYGSDFDTQLDAFLEMGFEEVLRDPFKAETYEGKSIWEQFVVLWHPDGLLAKMESYHGTGRNTADVFYNIRFNDDLEDRWSITSSGGMRGDVWVGHHDAREGIKHNIANLRANGEFLSTWVEQPFLWLLCYMDTKVDGYDYKAITAERISRLPQHVQDAIKGRD